MDDVPSVKVRTLTVHSWNCTKCNFENSRYFSVLGTDKCDMCKSEHDLVWVNSTPFDIAGGGGTEQIYCRCGQIFRFSLANKPTGRE